ncbi:hypothetical protein [Streptomyces sp. NPDC001137]|uniref:hypothetical protein n=1 Tax=Streptomyces sp. NPDC001137 TaxID=3154378 RepID=UPI00331DC3CA
MSRDLRAPWPFVLGLVLVAVVSALRPLEGALVQRYERTRPDVGHYRPWLLWPCLAACAGALSRFAPRGFTDDGRFPALPALGLALGAVLVLLHRRPVQPINEAFAHGVAQTSPVGGIRSPGRGTPEKTNKV